jgi:hypothetical protein
MINWYTMTMKNLYFIFISMGLIMLNWSCSDPSKSEKTDLKSFKKPNDLDGKMAEIENNPNWKVMSSLAYNNNSGSTEEVRAYLNDRDDAVKLEERYSDVATGNYGTRYFYLSNQKMFASKEVFFDQSLKKPGFVERITFYNKNQEPIYTCERNAATELDLENNTFHQVQPHGLSISRAMQVLNQQGAFATTFQGFVQSGDVLYLLVGENTEDGFASSLVVQYESEDIKKLKSNERGMIGTPLLISHQTMVDERGLKFQVLINLVINS